MAALLMFVFGGWILFAVVIGILFAFAFDKVRTVRKKETIVVETPTYNQYKP